MKSYVRNTINLSCAKILLTSVISTQKSQSRFDLLHVLKPNTTTQNVGKVSEWITDNVTEFLRWICRLKKKEFAIGWWSEAL